MAKSTQSLVVLVGDYKRAGPSERWAHGRKANRSLSQNYLRSGTVSTALCLSSTPLIQAAMTQSSSSEHSGQKPRGLADIPITLFADEMYPIQDNLPDDG